MEYKPVIGLEIHSELKTESKMFCDCKNNPKETRPNFNICPVCTAQPGSLPTINKEAVKSVIKTGMALNCAIAEESYFERKNYFYPDLPKGYQITQYRTPLCTNGYLDIPETKAMFSRVRIERIHLEEDTGKLIHPQDKNYSLIDFNRAGTPLMELVTKADIDSGKKARKFAEELQAILRYLKVSNADMEKGEMRVEVNISLRPVNNETASSLGVKVEIKNLNSFRAVGKAIEYERKRQQELLNSGEKITQETRGWDENKKLTFPQRKKEESADYRYFPEPDLPRFHTSDIKIQASSQITELPQQKRERFKKEYQLSEEEIEVFIKNRGLANYFEKMVSELKNWIKFKKIPKSNTYKLIESATNYLLSDLQGLMTKHQILIKNIKISPENFAELITILWNGEISSKAGKKVLEEMFQKGGDPSHIIKEKNLAQISDTGELESIAKKVIEDNPQAVSDYKQGKENAIQFLLGQVMKKSKGKANPPQVNKLLKQLLS